MRWRLATREGRRETHLGSLDLLRVLLSCVSQLENVLLTEIGIVIETEFGVHTERVIRTESVEFFLGNTREGNPL